MRDFRYIFRIIFEEIIDEKITKLICFFVINIIKVNQYNSYIFNLDLANKLFDFDLGDSGGKKDNSQTK